MICAGMDQMLRVYDGSKVLVELEQDTTILCMRLASSENSLYAGCRNGALRVYSYPLSGEFKEHWVHSQPISGLCVSSCETMVFTVGRDGSVIMHDVVSETRRAERRDASQWVQEVLVSRVELEEKAAVLLEAEGRVKALTSQNEYTLKIAEKNHEDAVKKLQLSFETQISKERGR